MPKTLPQPYSACRGDQNRVVDHVHFLDRGLKHARSQCGCTVRPNDHSISAKDTYQQCHRTIANESLKTLLTAMSGNLA